MTKPPSPQAARRNRRTLLLIALVAVAPVVASYVVYYWFPRDKQVNYGELIATPAPALRSTPALTWADGKWTVAFAASGECDAGCRAALYATRQARTLQGREMQRVRRVWLVTGDDAPAPAVLSEQPDLVVVRASPDALRAWPAGQDRIYLVDPLGNVVLAWPREPDIKKMGRDLERLLRASRIG